MIFFKWLDKIRFLNIRVWDFSLKSLIRYYGIAFIFQIILKHPVKTITGIKKYQKLTKNKKSAGRILVNPLQAEKCTDQYKSVTGAGFCLKPLKPECISGRANHDCRYFENHFYLRDNTEPLCCKDCMIKKIGLMALSAKSSFYIMTSAKDILFDIIQPSVRSEKFQKGLFYMCNYSFEPFKIALSISGIDACLYSFDAGDCKDYKSWLRADIGIKNEQTTLHKTVKRSIESNLSVSSTFGNTIFKKAGNIFLPL
ncbi:MAG: hypothetical protein JSV22_08285 [Bacteroidales bacterium]|nr:MAG: hypothetical protein JSV22_08285 [Bacteroidales bacterium]